MCKTAAGRRLLKGYNRLLSTAVRVYIEGSRCATEAVMMFNRTSNSRSILSKAKSSLPLFKDIDNEKISSETVLLARCLMKKENVIRGEKFLLSKKGLKDCCQN